MGVFMKNVEYWLRYWPKKDVTAVYWQKCYVSLQWWSMVTYDIDGLVQERRNSIANALELRLSCTNPSSAELTVLIPCDKCDSYKIINSCKVDRYIYALVLISASVREILAIGS